MISSLSAMNSKIDGAVLQYCDVLFRHHPDHAGTRLAQRRGAAAELLGTDRPKLSMVYDYVSS